MSNPFFQIDNIEAISVIEVPALHEDLSHDTGFFSGHAIDLDDDNIKYRIKVKSPTLDLQANTLQIHKNFEQESVEANQEPLTQNITGYDLNRELFSETDIADAFKVIDINRDDAITYEDISFFLEYINEPYVAEQIHEMISLVSADPTRVLLEDFKKIAKGTIIPLASFRVPDARTQAKQTLLANLNQAFPEKQPEEVLKASRAKTISPADFEQEKLRSQEKIIEKQLNTKQSAFSKMEKILELKSQKQLELRRMQFEAIDMVNLKEVLRNCQECEQFKLDVKQIAGVLQISEKKACSLYPSRQVQKQRLAAEAITHSRINPISKLEQLLGIISNQKCASLEEIIHVFGLFQGREQIPSVRKKLIALLSPFFKDLSMDLDKQYVLHLISQERLVFDL